jgi:protease IV
MEQSKQRFSQRHPFLFGLLLMFTAVALFSGATAVWRSWVENHPERFQIFAKPKIGLVHVEGVILDVADTLQWIRRLREDASVKGILVRVNSPGGVVGPSQELHRGLERAAREKPVVVSMGAVAASGGYYVATAGHTIMANPGTLTGSIGVKLELTNLQGLMEKLGITRETLDSGKFKSAGSPFTELTPEEREYFQAVIMDMHAQFVRDVARGRKMSLEDVQALADGRIMTGLQALEHGLVDEIGGQEEAVELLKKLAKIEEKVHLITDPSRDVPLWKKMLGAVEKELQSMGPMWVYR